jgi:hypothetical protein
VSEKCGVILLLTHQKNILYGFCLVLLVVFLQAVFATQLNHLYYQFYGPFYDSAGYYLELKNIVLASQQGGFLSGFQQATHILTGFFPFFLIAIAGCFVAPSRDLAIYVQAGMLFSLGASVFCYFYNYYFHSVKTALAFSLLFLTPWVIWNFNGGLSDFRVDLGLYIFSGTAFIWFLATRYTEKLYPWLLFGLFTGLAFLSRATAPAYFIIGLAPILAYRFLTCSAPLKLSLFKKLMLSIAVAFCLSAWFFILKGVDLYQYYFINNIDSTAHLPFSLALKHVEIVIKSIGTFPLLFSLFLLFLQLLSFYITRAEVGKGNACNVHWRAFDGEALWLGIAPLVLLVGKGMGLNPFVSMPAIFGLILFLIKPFTLKNKEYYRYFNQPVISMIILCASLSVFVLSAGYSIHRHLPTKGFIPEMIGLKQVRDTILLDSQAHFENQVISFAIPSNGSITPVILWNTFFFDMNSLSIQHMRDFDRHFKLNEIGCYQTFSQFSSGQSRSARIPQLARQIDEQVQYLILPDEKSITFLEQNFPFNYSNLVLRELKSVLLKTNRWVPISGLIRMHAQESVVLYRRKESPFAL